MQSDELSLRVGQLDSAKTRARLESALRGAVELADRQPATRRTPPIRRGDIRANRELLLELAECLGVSRPLSAMGLAMTFRLIHDSPSPLYQENAGRSLKVAAFEALVALERGGANPSSSDTTARVR